MCEEGVRGMQDPGQLLQHLFHSGRRWALCGKKEKKYQIPVKRSARISQPCILPQWGSDNLLYIITCQKYKHNVSAWMCQLKPGRKMSLRHSQAPGSAWLQCLSHACTLQNTYFIGVQLSGFVFILPHVTQMGWWHCQECGHGLAQLTPSWVKSWLQQGLAFRLEGPENWHSREK